MLVAGVALVAGCATWRLEVPHAPSHAIDAGQDSFLARNVASRIDRSSGLSGFRVLASGQEAFLARAALAESAQHSLDLQYFIVAEDATATLLLYRTLRAAQRGVRVRLLVDDLYVAGRDADLAVFAAHPNVEVRVFNPFRFRSLQGLARILEILGDGARLNQRMHNKLWIADNAAGVVGGRNLGDAYFAAQGASDFADLDLLATGPIVAELSRSFDEYWNSELAVPIEAIAGEPPVAGQLEEVLAQMASKADRFRDTEYAQSLRATDLGRLLRRGEVPLVAARATALRESPAKPPGDAADRHPESPISLRPIVEKARREAILVSPYFIPSERGMGVLCALVRQGIRVRILTNSLASTDVPVVHAGYAHYRPRLLACGVELHELRPGAKRAEGARRGLSSGGSLHAKALVVDREVVVVGSMNFDPRSRFSNTEIGVLIESAELGGELGTLFDEATSLDQSFRVELTNPGDENSPLTWAALENGLPVRYTEEPLAGWWRRVSSAVLGALAPEEML